MSYLTSLVAPAFGKLTMVWFWLRSDRVSLLVRKYWADEKYFNLTSLRFQVGPKERDPKNRGVLGILKNLPSFRFSYLDPQWE
jgi:hypothetical protein